MAPLIVLVVVTLLARLLGYLGVALLRDWAVSTRVALAVMFCFTAAAHFSSIRPDLVAMVPPFASRSGVRHPLRSYPVLRFSYRSSFSSGGLVCGNQDPHRDEVPR